ncbi:MULTISPECIES: SDR family oxidoreductase [unclassified Planococcus (in: firmicutes)]|uniref:SDR family oxidoreductase n=1 Tax=unclassified Planococcus (in: firmicutes) TaxID=2662419 RepID=UPI000C7D398B|nr:MULTISPECIES: SDR family oxidoreductase [unclassified Planococcus (in: firmicutes)]PKG45486.1 short-chain dehydrogenase [Planococcus sp. Urea-trap-24]PKG88917.1 short-chain dehydrogenase [Planococcus sp. Urea-3u-39]PKH36285.1 short-chain dehydrogenase [Planococcus sp. MB-3u-09]
MANEKILITGAGTGFGKNIAFSLAEKGKSVIAGVEIISQVSALEQEAKERGVSMQIEKLDVTNPKDREKAWGWDIDVLVNNAAVSEGGSLVDIPEENLRHQFEVNVFGPVLLTKGFARQMVERKSGRIVFVSSVSGLMADPLMGPYCGTKHATEAFADSLSKELQEFNVEVATINPGPYLTGFNDREFETWKNWQSDLENTVFDYEKAAFPYEQFDPKEVTEPSVKVILGETNQYRNVIPEKMIPQVKERMEAMWSKTTTEGLGERDETVQKSYEIEPGTPAE